MNTNEPQSQFDNKEAAGLTEETSTPFPVWPLLLTVIMLVFTSYFYFHTHPPLYQVSHETKDQWAYHNQAGILKTYDTEARAKAEALEDRRREDYKVGAIQRLQGDPEFPLLRGATVYVYQDGQANCAFGPNLEQAIDEIREVALKHGTAYVIITTNNPPNIGVSRATVSWYEPINGGLK